MRRGIIVLCLAAASFLLSACGGGGNGGGSEASAETTSTTMPPPVVPEHDDDSQTRSEGVVLLENDVPEGWVPIGDGGVDDLDGPVRACLGIDPGDGEKGQHTSGFAYTDANGGVRSITAQVRVYEDDEAARSVADAWIGGGLPACLTEVLVDATGMGGEFVAVEARGGALVSFDAEFGGGGAGVKMGLDIVHEPGLVALVRGVAMGGEITDEDLSRATEAISIRGRES